jgi:hypothetical protein
MHERAAGLGVDPCGLAVHRGEERGKRAIVAGTAAIVVVVPGDHYRGPAVSQAGDRADPGFGLSLPDVARADEHVVGCAGAAQARRIPALEMQVGDRKDAHGGGIGVATVIGKGDRLSASSRKA